MWLGVVSLRDDWEKGKEDEVASELESYFVVDFGVMPGESVLFGKLE